jgi:YD repeat-containing protein
MVRFTIVSLLDHEPQFGWRGEDGAKNFKPLNCERCAMLRQFAWNNAPGQAQEMGLVAKMTEVLKMLKNRRAKLPWTFSRRLQLRAWLSAAGLCLPSRNGCHFFAAQLVGGMAFFLRGLGPWIGRIHPGTFASFSYDGAGNVTAERNAQGEVTMYLYDAVNRVTIEQLPLGETVTTTYDAAGNVFSIKDGDDNLTTFAYDRVNEKTSSTDPDGRVTLRSYDFASQVTSTTDADGRTIKTTFDGEGNITGKTWLRAEATGATYNAGQQHWRSGLSRRGANAHADG